MLEPGRNPQSDLSLLAAVRRGDPRALDGFLERMRCVPLIVTALNAKLGRPLDANELNDVSQDTLMTIWQRLGAFEGRSTLETWVYRFCSFMLLNAIRKRRRARVREELADDATERAAALEPWATYDDVHRAIDRLSSQEAACVRLKHFDDLTFEEIGSRLSISPNTAKTQYYRGLRKLRDYLRAREGESAT
jgi:RNA polymerase sigma-70 factor (ECF subfamily)